MFSCPLKREDQGGDGHSDDLSGPNQGSRIKEQTGQAG